MITGIVLETLEASVVLRLRGPLGDTKDEIVTIDTGFDGDLTLPIHTIGNLALLYLFVDTVTLADGTQAQIPVYQATVDWDGQQRNILVFEAEGVPLLGTSLLANHDLFVRFVVGGEVSIQHYPK